MDDKSEVLRPAVEIGLLELLVVFEIASHDAHSEHLEVELAVVRQDELVKHRKVFSEIRKRAGELLILWDGVPGRNDHSNAWPKGTANDRSERSSQELEPLG